MVPLYKTLCLYVSVIWRFHLSCRICCSTNSSPPPQLKKWPLRLEEEQTELSLQEENAVQNQLILFVQRILQVRIPVEFTGCKSFLGLERCMYYQDSFDALDPVNVVVIHFAGHFYNAEKITIVIIMVPLHTTYSVNVHAMKTSVFPPIQMRREKRLKKTCWIS